MSTNFKAFLPSNETKPRIKAIRKLKGNNTCIDCQKKNPKWASVYLGCLICMDCSGRHRALGVRYSFVRSLNMDQWSEFYLNFMEKGGNQRLREYLQQNGVNIMGQGGVDYKSEVMERYQKEMREEVQKLMQSSQTTTQQPQEQPNLNSNKIITKPKKKPSLQLKPTKKPKRTSKSSKKKKVSQTPNPNMFKKKKTQVDFQNLFGNDDNLFTPQKRKIKAKKVTSINFDELKIQNDAFTFKPMSFSKEMQKQDNLEDKNKQISEVNERSKTDNKNESLKQKKNKNINKNTNFLEAQNEIQWEDNTEPQRSKSFAQKRINFSQFKNVNSISSKQVNKQNQFENSTEEYSTSMINSPKNMQEFTDAQSISSDQFFNSSQNNDASSQPNDDQQVGYTKQLFNATYSKISGISLPSFWRKTDDTKKTDEPSIKIKNEDMTQEKRLEAPKEESKVEEEKIPNEEKVTEQKDENETSESSQKDEKTKITNISSKSEAKIDNASQQGYIAGAYNKFSSFSTMFSGAKENVTSKFSGLSSYYYGSKKQCVD